VAEWTFVYQEIDYTSWKAPVSVSLLSLGGKWLASCTFSGGIKTVIEMSYGCPHIKPGSANELQALFDQIRIRGTP